MPKRKLTLEQLHEKVLAQHALRVEQLKANPDFTAELEALERLINETKEPFAPIDIRKKNTPEEREAQRQQFYSVYNDRKWQTQRFKERRQTGQFEERWRVCVLIRRKDDDRRYISIAPAAVRGQQDFRTGEVIITDPGYYGTSIKDMARLLKPMVRGMQRPWALRTRYRVGPTQVKAIARKLKAQGKSLQEIAAQLYPDEYKAAVTPPAEPDEATIHRRLQLTMQYIKSGLSWLQAEKKASADLGIDRRSKKAKLAKLTKRVRALLRRK